MGRLFFIAAAILLIPAGCAGSGRVSAGAHRPADAAYATPTQGSAGNANAAASIGASTSSASGGAAQTSTSINPGPLHIPAAGSYHAQMTRSGSTQAVTISVALSRASGTETDVTTTTTLAGGSQQINSEAWRPDGIYLTQTSYVSNGKRVDCTFQSPVLESKLPLSVGSTWSSSGTCTTPAPNATTTTVSISAGVTGTARQTIGGVTVATYVIKGQLTTDTKGSYAQNLNGIPQPPQPFELKTTSQLTVYVDAAAGLDVRTITDSTTDYNGKSSSSTSETVYTSLKPS